jgi:hypothetical protein
MNKLAWIVPLALLTTAPAWSWCVDHDAADAKYYKEHPRPICDRDADGKHVAGGGGMPRLASENPGVGAARRKASANHLRLSPSVPGPGQRAWVTDAPA